MSHRLAALGAQISLLATVGLGESRRPAVFRRAPPPAAAYACGNPTVPRSISGVFVRRIKVPGFSPSLTAALPMPSITQLTSRKTLRMCRR
jgi:hypothetical protein